MIPDTVFQGTTFAGTFVCTTYPPTTHTGELRLTQTGETPITLTGTDAGDESTHTFTATPAATTAWAAGVWSWTLLASLGTDLFFVQSGTLTVAAIGAASELTTTRDRLSAAEAELAERTTGKPYALGWRDSTITRMTVAELMDAIGYFKRRIAELESAHRAACGKPRRTITYGRLC